MPDVRLDPATEFGNHSLGCLRKQLRQQERSYALYDGRRDYNQYDDSQNVNLAFSDDIIDQVSCGSRKNQARDTVNGHENQADPEDHSVRPNERPDFG
jgi:hypothetical protein